VAFDGSCLLEEDARGERQAERDTDASNGTRARPRLE
jgi:hypothetical protein